MADDLSKGSEEPQAQGQAPERQRPGEGPSYQEAEATLQKMAEAFLLLQEHLPANGVSEPARHLVFEADARFRTLVDQIPAVTFSAALAQGVNELYVSPQIEKLLGYSQKEWLEDPTLWYTRLHPDDRTRWHGEFAQTCLTGQHFRSEYRFLARDGRVVWVHGEAQLVRDEQGRPLFLQGVAFDITDSKRAEEALRRLHDDLENLVQKRTSELAAVNRTLQEEIRERQRLEEALRQRAEQLTEEARRKDQFLAVLAHELRNPLAPLRNALHLLRQPGTSSRVRERAEEMMDRQVRQMVRLIDDLLDVSRISQGKIELRSEVVDLAAIVARAVDSTRPFLDERRHLLTVTLPPGPVLLRGDSLRLEQVVVNLLNNAGKYTEPGGRIEIHVGGEADELVVRVRDSGVGIPAEMLERIFEMFTQVERTLASKFQWGLGIGLSLVRKLVELHGGSVRATSPGPGQGSEFVVRLPRLPKDQLRAEGEKSSGGNRPVREPAAGQAVLVAEDNVELAASTALLLRGWGYEVRVVHDGPSALMAAAETPPAVALLDIGLPGLDGYEVARHLRAKASLANTVLVAVTGFGQERDRIRSQEAGFAYHLTKPVEPEVLRELLASVG